MSAALKIVPTAVATAPESELRARAVAKFRELADKLERGELEGARVEWRSKNEVDEAPPKLLSVELDQINGEVRFRIVAAGE